MSCRGGQSPSYEILGFERNGNVSLTCLVRDLEWLRRAPRDSHVILGSQPTVRSVVAVEPVLQINVGLPDEIIGTHEVMIKYSHGQFWLSRERDA